MVHTTRKLLLAGAASGLIGSAMIPAHAADVSPTQAADVEMHIRNAIGSLFGPSLTLPDHVVQVTASGDHYDLAVPVPLEKLASLGGVVASPPSPPSGATMTGQAKQGENGVWTVENVKMTSPIAFSLVVPVPPADDEPAGSAPKTATVAYTVDQAGQDGRIVWDPSYQTTSTWTTSTQQTTLRARGGPLDQQTTIGPTNATSTLRPAGQGRIDLLLAGDLQDYDIDTNAAAMSMKIAMKRVRISSALNSVSRDAGVKMVQAATTLISNSPMKNPAAVPALVKSILASLEDFATDFLLDETVDGFAIQLRGQTVTLDRLRLGLDARSDTGLMRAGMDFAVDGIAVPGAPLGPFADLLPRRVAIRPILGGVSAHDLLHMANLATDNIDPTPSDIAALFGHGGITGGIESMALEVGGATFTGQGKLVATEPNPRSITGTAQLTAENFDSLMQKVNAIPQLAQQGVPAFVFIKGIGRSVGDKLVWDITFKDSRVLVNNVDLTAMAGAGPSAANPAPAQGRPAPGAAQRPSPRPATPGQVPSWAR